MGLLRHRHDRPVRERFHLREQLRVSIRNTVTIERGDHTVATVRKALAGLRDRFAIDSMA